MYVSGAREEECSQDWPEASDAERQEKQGTPTKSGSRKCSSDMERKAGGYEVQKSRNKMGVRDVCHHQMLLGA